MTMVTRFLAGDGGVLPERSVLEDHPAGYAGPYCLTYCCDLIFCASFALIGGRADERTTAPPTGGWRTGSSAARAGVVKLAAEAAVVTVAATVVLGANTGSPARDAAGGKTPSCVTAAPVGEKAHVA